MKRTYICEIYSNCSYPRYYDVDTTSAIKCARKLGRCDGGEVITVYGNKKMTRILSRAGWTPEKGGYYGRLAVDVWHCQSLEL